MFTVQLQAQHTQILPVQIQANTGITYLTHVIHDPKPTGTDITITSDAERNESTFR